MTRAELTIIGKVTIADRFVTHLSQDIAYPATVAVEVIYILDIIPLGRIEFNIRRKHYYGDSISSRI